MLGISSIERQIREKYGGLRIAANEPLCGHTSFRIGGPVDLLVWPDSADVIKWLTDIAKREGIPLLLMGNGTNLLIADQGFRGIAIKTFDRLSSVRVSGENEITADSGILLSRLAVFAKDNGLTGLEFAHGIPGTLGGAVCMNAGAYGGQMSDVVASSEYITPDGESELKAEGHDFQYRHSWFQDNTDAIITRSVLKLKQGDKSAIGNRMHELMEKRSASQPLNMPSAGSVFRRPQTGYAGAYIESCGLKGYAIGGAQVSEKHAGFIVNRGGAVCDDVLRLIEHIQSTVLRETGVVLETEVKPVGS